MAGRVSPTLLVLREIRDEIKETNVRLGRVEDRVGRVEDRVAGVEKRGLESENRLATEIVALAKVVGEVRDLL